MSRYDKDNGIVDFDAVRLTVASPEDILEWSHGEVTKPETINYRTQKPERDGLFCEKIFGPVKDVNPHDSKLKGVRYREAAVDKKGELVTKSIVRRERMGHIQLAAPTAHIWFMRGTPSSIGLVLGMTVKNLERVVYFASYIIKSVDLKRKEQLLADLEAEAEASKVAIKLRYEKEAEGKDVNIKVLAEAQTKELEENMGIYMEKKTQLDSLVLMSLLTETQYSDLPDEMVDMIEVGIGGQGIKDLLDKVDLEKLTNDLTEEADGTKGQRKKKIEKRLKVIEGMQRAGIKPSSMMLTVIPVIPPDLRPMVQLTGGRFATSDLNDLYRRVINRNNRLKKLLELKAPNVITRNEMRMLQEAVDALIDNSNSRTGRAVSSTGNRRRLKSLSDMLKGKQGRFRQNLLGKRVDYSGRSVIVSGPDLRLKQCGLPKMMALELFKPFIIGHLIESEKAHNIKSASRMIEAGETAVWDALDEVIKGKYVLLNRAPTLHRLGIQAFQPKLIEGKAIQLHPLVCKGFNADFDGDQMAVHLPLSAASQEEAREIMSAQTNLLKPADGSPILHIEQDIVLGCYYLTYDRPDLKGTAPKPFANIDDAIYALENGAIMLHSPIAINAKGERRLTTVGRALFNEIFPEDFPYQNQPMTKKLLSKTMVAVYNKFGQEATARIADDLKDIGFEYATLSGVSTGMDDYTDLENLSELLKGGELKAAAISDQYDQGFINNEERYRLTVDAWKDVDKKVTDALQEKLANEDTTTSMTVNSGARGNIGSIKQVAGVIGVTVDATGREIELPIRSSYKSSLSPLEYFVSTRGSRKGMISTALKTADSGYLTRRLVDVSQDVFTTENEAQDPGFAVDRQETEDIGLNFAERITGRVLAKSVKADNKQIARAGQLIDQEIAQKIAKSGVDEVKIKSVLSCSDLRGVTRESYGIDLATGVMVEANQPVGVIAAQSIGEPGTQLTLDVFHAGGVAGEDISLGLPRVEEIVEARAPKGQAFMSEVAGTVSVWEEGDDYIVQVLPEKIKTKVLKLNGRKAKVKSGTEVAAGDVLATSSDDSKPLTAPTEGTVEVFDDEIVIAVGEGRVARYKVPGFKQLTVADGDKVEAGARLTNGSLNLHDLLRLKGVEATQRYIMNEVLRIFASQGQTIADKHLEVVVRQMFSRVQIVDPGDTEFVSGDIVSKAAVVEQNHKLVDAGKEPAQFAQMLLGITKVSTWSDSFLSAASFQDTTRVLISAAITGKLDELRGLKENVIIGRKIPVGTGVVDEVTEVDE